MPYALVTGAAKGIGNAIANELAGKGYKLLLIDIDGKKLFSVAEQISSTHQLAVEALQLDLSTENSAQVIKEWSTPFHNELSVVVNNAGYGLNGAFEKLTIDEQLNIIDVNVKAQLKIAHAFIPVLKQF